MAGTMVGLLECDKGLVSLAGARTRPVKRTLATMNIRISLSLTDSYGEQDRYRVLAHHENQTKDFGTLSHGPAIRTLGLDARLSHDQRV